MQGGSEEKKQRGWDGRSYLVLGGRVEPERARGRIMLER